MKIENIFKSIPEFHNIVVDTILFESKYPVMFTCKNGKDVYLFICCLITADKAEWIGTKTTYDNLIELLENKITIRAAFLNVTEDKIVIVYDGKKVNYRVEKSWDIPENLLPTAGEYMDAEADEYAEEIDVFRTRNATIEYTIQPRTNRLFILRFHGKGVWVSDHYDFMDSDEKDLNHYKMEKSYSQKVVFG